MQTVQMPVSSYAIHHKSISVLIFLYHWINLYTGWINLYTGNRKHRILNLSSILFLLHLSKIPWKTCFLWDKCCATGETKNTKFSKITWYFLEKKSYQCSSVHPGNADYIYRTLTHGVLYGLNMQIAHWGHKPTRPAFNVLENIC
jgi:hypothetical protein